MHPSVVLAGVGLLIVVLWDAFETIVLPRRVRRRLRLTRVFYQITWRPFRALGRRFRPGAARENMLSIYGPISLLLLLVLWATMLVVGFALVHWGLGTPIQTPPSAPQGFPTYLYYSGTTLFTLGLGDVSPLSRAGRIVTVAEGGTGFGFLALVIGYLPILAQAFSRREVNVSLLDARAGSPPSAVELLRRHVEGDGDGDGGETLARLLGETERWAADLLESHISFPVLAYYRSQHDNQSWIAALTTILDVCALIMAGVEKAPVRAARLTFAMARHAAVDLCNLFKCVPRAPDPERLPPAELARVRAALEALGLPLASGDSVDERLQRLRRMYEPYLDALSRFLLMPLPPWLPGERARDNWEAMR
jgi:Ion channel